ncbi:MAG: OsmC family protein [Saprospiraceae bacterium]|nr:OsmC family protein [Saprospiraceae bacterium]HRG67451.1 OsmC family protein [Saprospiraceae bacterium]
MKTAEVIYTGDLRTQTTHIRSGQSFITDAPVDNQGKGEAFSPTDLAATSLACCMITTMGIAAKTHEIDMKGARAEVLKIMANDPRRIASIEVDIYMPDLPFSPKEKIILEKAANACPVKRSLHPDLKEVLRIHWA